VTLDIERLAREAKAIYTPTDTRPTSRVYAFDPYELHAFSALVLEEAAARWERSHGFDKHGCAAAIRALKPK
jgi:hypothetical protein